MNAPTPQAPPFESFEPLVEKQATYLWQRLPVPKPLEFCDLFGEAGLVYARLLPKWNPDRASFFTLYHTALRHHFIGLLRQAYRHKQMGVDVEKTIQSFEEGEVVNEALRVRRVFLSRESKPHIRRLGQRFLESLGRDALILVRTFFDPPRRFRLWEKRTYKNKARCGSRILSRVLRWLAWPDERRDAALEDLRAKMPRGI